MCSTSPLSKVASAILSMATTSAATERSLSTYSRIHTKNRHRLTTERAGKIVYIAHNLKLLTNHKTKKTTTTNAGDHGSQVPTSTVTKRFTTSSDSEIPAKQTKKTLVEHNKEL